jgi:hypothetical protein
MMIYEIRSKKYMSFGESSSIGYYYYNRKNAEEDCAKLNELLNVYFVAEVKMQDELKF